MSHDPIPELIARVYARHRDCAEGEVATYIPELGKADPAKFGICVVTAEGRVYEVGDCDEPFTIQSISKPFVYGLALEDHGRDEVLRRVGVEPSGEAFNSIVLDEATRRPFNPMVNAGAIATSALVVGASPRERFARVLERFGAAAGRELSIDESVYASELATGHRNRAIAHLMLNFGMLPGDVDGILDLYFRQCSILVNCRDLAMMGATLANVGTNPRSGTDVFRVDCVKDVLAVMFTCGMYDFSGEWAFRVGVPAKSGVAGGVLAVVNRQLGIGIYSPRLDARGNSVRGIRACVEIADELGLHAFDVMNFGSTFLRTLVRQT
jgi:glutaminase